MAEEPQSAPTTPIQQPQAQNNVIPDSILQEIEKVARMEKDITFLQHRQGSVEKSLTNLKDSLGENQEKTPATENNVIQNEEDKEEKKNDKKEDKDVLKSDKLKPQLTSVEKKRYENIGLEFAKGTQKIFKEIRQAEELKQKMSTKKLDDVKKKDKSDKDDKKKEKKEGGLGSLFLKLGLAIGAVAIILETFKDKIEKIIPGFSVSWNTFTNPIKNVGNRIIEKISDFLTNTIGTNLSTVFQSVGNGIMIFFTSGLPNAVYQSGQMVARAFGAEVTEDMKTLDASLGTNVDAHLRRGQSMAEAMAIANNPFSTDSDKSKTRSLSGLTALESVFDLKERRSIGEFVMLNSGYTEDQVLAYRDKDPNFALNFVTEDIANAIMHIIKAKGLDENGITQDEVLTILGEQGLGFSNLIDRSNGYRTEITQVLLAKDAAGGSKLLKAFQNYTSIHTGLENQPKLEEVYGQMATTLREDGFVVNNKDNKLEMTIEPVKVAQDIFVGELVYIYELFKSIFDGSSFANNVLSSASDVVKYTYDVLFQPFISVAQTLVRYCEEWAKIAYAKSPQTSSSTGGSASIPTSSGGTVNITNSTSPVVIIDFSLDQTVLNGSQEMMETKQQLVIHMKKVNEKLKSLRTIAISEAAGKNLKEIKALKDKVDKNTTDIGTQGKQITYIADYLEKHDNDEVEELNFDIEQAKSTAK